MSPFTALLRRIHTREVTGSSPVTPTRTTAGQSVILAFLAHANERAMSVSCPERVPTDRAFAVDGGHWRALNERLEGVGDGRVAFLGGVLVDQCGPGTGALT